ncbi:glycoside hydrolase family 32 protein [Flavobacterium buctense]|uniref:Glycoside hydrolase family 32 protein n=1 Tax=Flavobacterium buctense TaxID=1648146 RepID=A0ABU9E3F1_9FLAO|nr:glycoside hydrolase family 32 protein [Flavobacterium buctense]
MKIKFSILLCLLFQNILGQTDKNYAEPYRPQFHFTPPAKWMNDPNGLVYFNGKYHLFYQYFPERTVWGPMHWGHAESTDLLHWKQLPIALYPDELGWIFSGSAVIDKDNTAGFGSNAMIAIFTYHNDELWKAGQKNTESQAIAYSNDEGKTWTKYKGNPVLNNSGEQDFRDPKVFWHQETSKWIMALAVSDKIKLFSSTNLKEWQEESVFKPENDTENLGVWECPDLFPLMAEDSQETLWVLIVNHGDKAPNGGSGTRYFIGNFDGKTFTQSQKALWLDNGTDYYAAVTFYNAPQDKKIVLGWMSNWQYATKVPTEVWRSAMTLPRKLGMVKADDGYRLTQKMIPQFATLTKPEWELEKVNTPFEKKNLNLSQAEVTFSMDQPNDAIITLTNTKGELFTITITEDMVVTDRSNSGKTDFDKTFSRKPQVMPLGEKKVTRVQLILDKSSVEILLNDGLYSMTNLFFPTEEYSILNIITKDKKPLKNLKIKSVARIWD